MIKFQQELESICWQPAATSTPCPKNRNISKGKPDNKKVVPLNDIINALLNKGDTISNKETVETINKTSTKTKKNRLPSRRSSVRYFASSSSSDDDNDNDKPKPVKAPVIIFSENTKVPKSVLKNRNVTESKQNSRDDTTNKIEVKSSSKKPCEEKSTNLNCNIDNLNVVQKEDAIIQKNIVNEQNVELTKPEVPVNTDQCNKSSAKIPHTTPKKISKECKPSSQIKKPVRLKKPPKQFWIPEDKDVAEKKDEPVNKAQTEQAASTCAVPEKNKSVEEIPYKNTRKRSKEQVTKLEKAIAADDKRKKRNCENNSKRKKNVQSDTIQEKTEAKSEPAKTKKVVKVETNEPDSTTPDFFRRLDQLSFIEQSQAGVFTTQCWALKPFQCGMLKVGALSELYCKTSHSNSHFGGVLVRGRLKMKIGEEELELKEGDMAFVPPLTEWSAHNTQDTESMFYYWSGRFKV